MREVSEIHVGKEFDEFVQGSRVAVIKMIEIDMVWGV